MGYIKNEKPAKFDAKSEKAKEKKVIEGFSKTHENAIKEGEKIRASQKKEEASK